MAETLQVRRTMGLEGKRKEGNEEAEGRGARSLCPASQNVPALPGIPEDRGCQELCGCPGPEALGPVSGRTLSANRTYRRAARPHPRACPLPPTHFHSPFPGRTKTRSLPVSGWPAQCSPLTPGSSRGLLGAGRSGGAS